MDDDQFAKLSAYLKEWFDGVDERFERIDQRFDEVNDKLDQVATKDGIERITCPLLTNS